MAVLIIMLFAMTEGELYVIPVGLKLIVIEDAALSEAPVVAVVVCSSTFSLISGSP